MSAPKDFTEPRTLTVGQLIERLQELPDYRQTPFIEVVDGFYVVSFRR
jgi:hypothetical protein